MTYLHRLTFLGSIAIFAACAPAPSEAPASATSRVTDVGMQTVTSPNAKPGAKYMTSRSYDALVKAGALSAEQRTVIDRIKAYDDDGRWTYGVDALELAETPERWATFLPRERALFPSLWSLLEITSSVDPDTAPSDLKSLEAITKEVIPDAPRYDEHTRVPVANLPAHLQDIARRVVNEPGTNEETVSFAEVVEAVANYNHYVSSEYFRFNALLRNIELEAATPASFPHVALTEPADAKIDIAIGGANVHIERQVSERCDTASVEGRLTTNISITSTAPAGVKLTWTPLTDAGTMTTTDYSYQRPVEVFDSISPPYANTLKSGGRGVAIVEAWQNGTRLGQQLVVLDGNEYVSAKGRAIAVGGQLVCKPFAEDWAKPDASDGLRDVNRLPPGRYAIPTADYGTATLQIYGVGVLRLDVGGKSFWEIEAPTVSWENPNACWALTSLGPHDMVTGAFGAGPGFKLTYDTSEVTYAKESYGVCSGEDGHVVATLHAGDRL